MNSEAATSTDKPGDNSDSHHELSWKHRAGLLAILFHLGLLTVSLGASVQAPTWMSEVLRVGHSYLHVAHFAVDGRTIHLANGDANERPLELQMGTTQLLSSVVPGSGADDRQQRYLATVELLASQEQPSLAAELLTPLLRQSETVTAQPGDSPVLRLVRKPTILSSVADDQMPPEYEASVIFPDGRMDKPALLRILPDRLTAEAK